MRLVSSRSKGSKSRHYVVRQPAAWVAVLLQFVGRAGEIPERAACGDALVGWNFVPRISMVDELSGG